MKMRPWQPCVLGSILIKKIYSDYVANLLDLRILRSAPLSVCTLHLLRTIENKNFSEGAPYKLGALGKYITRAIIRLVAIDLIYMLENPI